jgi:hypothetical protein
MIHLVLLFALIAAFSMSGIERLVHPGSTARSLQKGLGLSSFWSSNVALASAVIEVAVVVLMTLGLSIDLPVLIRLGGVISAGLLATYASYILYIRKNHPGVSCGCDADEDPANLGSVARAGVLAVFALLSALRDWSSITGLDVIPRSSLSVAGLALGIMIFILPGALSPDPATRARGAQVPV